MINVTNLKAIPEYHSLHKAQFFNDIAPMQQPVVIRNFVNHWPLVDAAKKGSAAFVHYLLGFYQGQKANMVVAPPSAKKRFYYNEEMTDVNYLQGEERVDLFLGRLLELVERKEYPAISMQNAQPSEILPGLVDDNPSAFFPDLQPRLWIGNEGIVSAHYDGSDNLACVVAGRRRFVLFPPEQTKNLYPGSLSFTPAGAPTSLVNLAEPDFEKYPLFEQALENAYCAELSPGDAIFIPMLWWHHVESLSKVNGLMNYWWNGSSAPTSTSPTPIDSLNIALLAMRNLSPKQRLAWRNMFDHYLFRTGVDPADYIPQQQCQLLGEMSPQYIEAVKEFFIKKLQKE